MTNTTEKDKVLLSLTMLTDLADENSNLPAMHQIRLLGNDLIDLITSEIVLVKSPVDDLDPAPERWVPPQASVAPPILPSSPPFPPQPSGTSLRGANRLRQRIYDLTFKDIGNQDAEKLYRDTQDPIASSEDTLLLNALERELSLGGGLSATFESGAVGEVLKFTYITSNEQLTFAGKPREALRKLRGGHKVD